MKSSAPSNRDQVVNSTDTAPMARLAAGDRSALRDLLEVHGEMLGRLVGRLTAWHADGDDILQEIMVIVWQQAGRYRGSGSLEGWLKRIAVNQCRNHFRMRNRFHRKLEALALGGQLRQGVPPDPLYSDESEGRLQQALARLAPDDRTAVVLFYLEEMPGDQVAEALNIKPETLHVRLHRIRKKLKQMLEELGDADGR